MSAVGQKRTVVELEIPFLDGRCISENRRSQEWHHRKVTVFRTLNLRIERSQSRAALSFRAVE